MKKWIKRICKFGCSTALLVGLTVIIGTAASFFSDYEAAPFVIDKGAIARTPTWRTALLIHAVSGIACLAACSLQLIRKLRVSRPDLHRKIGTFFSATLLLCVLPSGFYLAVFAKGGILGTIGFFLNGLLALFFTLFGLHYYKKRQYREHGNWMLRAFAMVATAVTFRYLYAGFTLIGYPGSVGYNSSVWGAVILNYSIAEYVIYRSRYGNKKANLH